MIPVQTICIARGFDDRSDVCKYSHKTLKLTDSNTQNGALFAATLLPHILVPLPTYLEMIFVLTRLPPGVLKC